MTRTLYYVSVAQTLPAEPWKGDRDMGCSLPQLLSSGLQK